MPFSEINIRLSIYVTYSHWVFRKKKIFIHKTTFICLVFRIHLTTKATQFWNAAEKRAAKEKELFLNSLNV